MVGVLQAGDAVTTLRFAAPRSTSTFVRMTKAHRRLCRQFYKAQRQLAKLCRRGFTRRNKTSAPNLIDVFVARARAARAAQPRPRVARTRSPRRHQRAHRTRRAATDSGGSSDGDGPPRRRLRRATRGPPGRALAERRPENTKPRRLAPSRPCRARGPPSYPCPACCRYQRSAQDDGTTTRRASIGLFPTARSH
jgi:hypothetical protein